MQCRKFFVYLLISCALWTQKVDSLEIQGHRGMRGLLPENSIPAFIAAIESGANAIELDVLVTKDFQIIVHHNFFVNKELCAYLDGSTVVETPLIRDLTLAEIKQLDCGCKQNPKFLTQNCIPGTQIPTLQEVFNLIKSLNHPNADRIWLNIEIKVDLFNPNWTISPAEFAKLVVAEVDESGLEDRIYFSSFNLEVLHEVRKLKPDVKLGFIFEKKTLINAFHVDPLDWLEFVIECASKLNAAVISPNYKLLDKEKISKLHAIGIQVIPWTVNDPNIVTHLIEMGVDGVITDYASDILEFLRPTELTQKF